MSIDQENSKLQIDGKIVPKRGLLSDDDAIYWAKRTLQILPNSRVVILRSGIDREVKLAK